MLNITVGIHQPYDDGDWRHRGRNPGRVCSCPIIGFASLLPEASPRTPAEARRCRRREWASNASTPRFRERRDCTFFHFLGFAVILMVTLKASREVFERRAGGEY